MISILRKNLLFILLNSILYSQEPEKDTLALDWSDVSWNEITDITTEVFEVENITHTAGVRGDEAKNEVLKYLWYRTKAIRKN